MHRPQGFHCSLSPPKADPHMTCHQQVCSNSVSGLRFVLTIATTYLYNWVHYAILPVAWWWPKALSSHNCSLEWVWGKDSRGQGWGPAGRATRVSRRKEVSQGPGTRVCSPPPPPSPETWDLARNMAPALADLKGHGGHTA